MIILLTANKDIIYKRLKLRNNDRLIHINYNLNMHNDGIEKQYAL